MPQPPVYPEEAVRHMREELTSVGVEELKTPEEVDRVLNDTKGTALVIINSVCGCAAGNARPGLALALQHKVIPDRVTTAFAGMERDAVDRVRALHEGYAPSSPSIVLFKDGKLAHMMQRSDIEVRSAQQVAEVLTGLFDQHCSKAGPSIPPEEFAKLSHAQICGSKIPKIGP